MIIMRTGTMTRKKTKRVNVRAPLNGHQATRRHQFFNSGAIESLILLAAFVIASSFILVFEGSQTFRDFAQGDGSFYGSFLLMIALMLILSAALGLYIWAFQPRIVKNHLRGGVLLATMLIMIIPIRAGVSYSVPERSEDRRAWSCLKHQDRRFRTM